ncbi:MAG TPA: NADH-quinone oxidoreductase subunit N [Chloroflexota bacterium]|nr:NADH-quinone oxidoreductase subunit N [Chloroflexota bacterium]
MPTVDVNQLNYGLIVPELVVLGLIFLTWVLDLMLPAGRKAAIGWVTVVGLVVAIATAVPLWGVRDDFAVVLRIDEFSTFFKLLFLGTAIGITLISIEYADRFLFQPGEFYGLVLCGTLGMIFMAEANELLTAYIALELLSFSSYVLVSYAKTNLKSNEAGMKYIILGAFSSALLLYGISLLYGTLGTTYFPDIARNVERLGVVSPAFGVGLALIMAGLGFKVAAVPFHMWTPDVYEGAPTPITAYLSVASKAGAFALVMRFLIGALLPLRDQYQVVFAVLAVLTMTVGNLVAIQQRNVKRLLAYSSIAQAGYVLVGLAAITADVEVSEHAVRGMMLHLAGYAFTNLAAFGAFIAFQNLNQGRELVADLAGLARRAPFVALAMMAGLFSLAGMPFFAGFVTKFYLFAAAARAELLWLVAIGVINSTISLYYYLLVVYQMYVRPPVGFEVPDGHGHAAVTHAPQPVLAGAVPVAATAGGGTVALHAEGGASGAEAGHGYAGHGSNGHAADGHSGGPDVPWWGRSITAEMPPEQFFPPYRVSRTITLSLVLFLVGVFFLGLWPQPVMDLLQAAGRSLFVG